jgi:hypothetical protein
MAQHPRPPLAERSSGDDAKCTRNREGGSDDGAHDDVPRNVFGTDVLAGHIFVEE